jgi:hypothetical protein
MFRAGYHGYCVHICSNSRELMQERKILHGGTTVPLPQIKLIDTSRMDMVYGILLFLLPHKGAVGFELSLVRIRLGLAR